LIVDPFESAWPDSQVELGPETDDIAHYFGTQVRAKVLRA
jgi:hypothetical protein